jgi:hypothetical protein
MLDLFFKLIYLKVPMYIIRFIKNFLTDRTFRVKVGEAFRKPHPVTCSVPQGSVLFSGGNGDRLDFDLQLNGESIPYNPNPVFLGITFDEKLCFNTHFENLGIRALKRLNILRIFSHKSCYFNRKTLTNIYSALIGSIFDYSFFSGTCISDTSLGLVQRI